MTMRSKSMHKWMSDEMERLSAKLARYKPTGSGYNRIQPILLPRSVTQMLNNPLPPEDQQSTTRAKGVLSRSESEWEEVYPTVQFSSLDKREKDGKRADCKFTYYRNCSTRIT